MSKTKFGRNTLTSREIRRIGEREATREKRQAAIDAFWNLSPEERQQRIQDDKTLSNIQRNGITIEDLDRAAQEGYRDGNRIGAENTMKICYAAVALTLHEKLGYGKKRCMDFLNAMDEKVIYSLDSAEAVQKVFDDIGLQLRFRGDPLDDRIIEKEG